MWKESIVADFVVLSRQFTGGTDENHGEPQSVCGRRFEPVPPQYECCQLEVKGKAIPVTGRGGP
jgi:hypothetical protein